MHSKAPPDSSSRATVETSRASCLPPRVSRHKSCPTGNEEQPTRCRASRLVPSRLAPPSTPAHRTDAPHSPWPWCSLETCRIAPFLRPLPIPPASVHPTLHHSFL